METLANPTKTKAIKEHNCNFCGEKITQTETYMKSTHKMDGSVYDWKTHLACDKIAAKLDMYKSAHDSGYEGVNQEFFMETIECKHDDLLIDQLPKSDNISQYSDIIQQLRRVRFKDKLSYVIRHYAKLERAEQNTPTNQ